MTHIINYAKLLTLLQKRTLPNEFDYVLQDDIKEEVLKMLRHYTSEMLENGNDFFFHQWGENNYTFDIDQIKLELLDFFDKPIEKLQAKTLFLNCRDFIRNLNDLSQYDAFQEYDDDIDPFSKYVCTIAEFWLDELECIQKQYLIDRDKDAADLISNSYLESLYSPYTVLGRKRFDKERDALFN